MALLSTTSSCPWLRHQTVPPTNGTNALPNWCGGNGCRVRASAVGQPLARFARGQSALEQPTRNAFGGVDARASLQQHASDSAHGPIHLT
jgi:hypothetical protein